MGLPVGQSGTVFELFTARVVCIVKPEWALASRGWTCVFAFSFRSFLGQLRRYTTMLVKGCYTLWHPSRITGAPRLCSRQSQGSKTCLIRSHYLKVGEIGSSKSATGTHWCPSAYLLATHGPDCAASKGAYRTIVLWLICLLVIELWFLARKDSLGARSLAVGVCWLLSCILYDFVMRSRLGSGKFARKLYILIDYHKAFALLHAEILVA